MKGLAAGVIVIVILALIISATGDGGERKPTEVRGPKAATVRVDGSFERSTRGDGTPVFSAVDMAAGETTRGTVDIANSGKDNGYFILSQADLTDLPGPGGGALSKRLGLTVRDVTANRAPMTIYRGPLNAMGARSVGFIEPGATRRYDFVARVDRPGDAKPIAGVDDPYADSATTVRYVWSALAAAPPKPVPPKPAPPKPAKPEVGRPPRPVGDRRPPVLKVDFPPVQPLIDRDYLVKTIACDERCIVRIKGSVQVGRRRPVATTPLITALRPNRPLVVRTRIPRRVLGAMRRSLQARRPATIRLTIDARDRSGNRSAVKRVVRLNPRVR